MSSFKVYPTKLLTESQQRSILNHIEQGWLKKEIANYYNVSVDTIRKVEKYQTKTSQPIVTSLAPKVTTEPKVTNVVFEPKNSKVLTERQQKELLEDFKETTESGKALSNAYLSSVYNVSQDTIRSMKKYFIQQKYLEESDINTSATVTEKSVKTGSEIKTKMIEYSWQASDKFLNITTSVGDVFTVTSDSPEFANILNLAITGQFAEAINCINIKKSVLEVSEGYLTIKGSSVYFGSLEIKNSVVDRIVDIVKTGGDFKPMVKFLQNLIMNPSQTSINTLWAFMANNDITINNDGFIVAYKKVKTIKNSLFDSHTGKIPNDVGNLVQMPRAMVVEDPNQTCEQGLHVGAWSYVPSFSGDTILRVLVNPCDVVSVPKDYNGSKMRTSRYFVDAIINNNKDTITDSKGIVKAHIIAGPKGEFMLNEPTNQDTVIS